MEFLTQSHFIALCVGIALCGIFLVMSLWNHWGTKREFNRYKKMLADKLELEHRHLAELNKERDRLLKESESLRMQVSKLNERTDNKTQRELEIYARAEKQMMINAPGFAPAWEIAKHNSQAQMQEEERGNGISQRIYRKLVGGTPSNVQALPAEAGKNGATDHAA